MRNFLTVQQVQQVKQSAFYSPNVNLFGRGTVNEVGSCLKELGVKKALLVTDADLHSLGVSEKIAGIIRESGVQVVIFPKAEPNPTDKNIAEGLDVLKLNTVTVSLHLVAEALTIAVKELVL
jgi:alcohol dehydrogenase class IV